MPVTIERVAPAGVAQLGGLRERRMRRGSIRDRGKRIDIGLVNNMPDAALLATERQFSSLLTAASGRTEVRLHLLALSDVPRSAEARATLNRTYRDVSTLRTGSLDALIVTGAEPIARQLDEEPYWRALVELIDWADANTVSTILSCLAAHAGVLRLDGIAREPLSEKCSGVFTFETIARNRLASGFGPDLLTPHSRRNGLSRETLVRQDYQIVTQHPDVGVDIFTKQRNSLFVFLQGHPEYEDDSLAREYRRDMNRFLRGDMPREPAIPSGYFSPEVERALRAFAERVRFDRRPEMMAEFPDAGAFGPGDAPWRKSAIQLYRNWLDIIAERKTALLDEGRAPVARLGG
jgi:homoserine O-succinyltransferase